jgi:CRP-like cAMP-binding protein
MAMTDPWVLTAVAGVGVFTTSAVVIGATLGLYLPVSRQLLAAVLAFAAGVLVASLSIELAFGGAGELHRMGFAPVWAWTIVTGGITAGAGIYLAATRALDRRGAAIRSATRFREYALERKKEDIDLLAKCDLLRHLRPEAIDDLMSRVERQHVAAGQILFRAGDPGDALYIVAKGRVAVLPPSSAGVRSEGTAIAELGEGAVFGEMALLAGAPRTATIRAETDADLLRLEKADFDWLLASNRQLAIDVQRLSHERAISNLATGRDPAQWKRVAQSSLDHLSRRETDKMLSEAGHGAGLAIMLGDLLDTIPGLLVVGASFESVGTLSLTVMMGIFLSGIPESAASAALLKRAGYSTRGIYRLWLITFLAGPVVAVAGKLLLGGSHSVPGIIAEAMAAGSLLGLVSHAMIPEALHQGGSMVVIPTVAGFVVALYLILLHTLA